MRKRASWMVVADDNILELLRDLSASKPREMTLYLDYSREYISRRLNILHSHGLVDKPVRGLYRENDNMHAYLDEELDASELEASEE